MQAVHKEHELSDSEKSTSHVFKNTYDMYFDNPEEIGRELAEVHIIEMDDSNHDPNMKHCDPD